MKSMMEQVEKAVHDYADQMRPGHYADVLILSEHGFHRLEKEFLAQLRMQIKIERQVAPTSPGVQVNRINTAYGPLDIQVDKSRSLESMFTLQSDGRHQVHFYLEQDVTSAFVATRYVEPEAFDFMEELRNL